MSVDYTLILNEWTALLGFLKSVDGDLEAKGMSEWLEEKGHIAPKVKGKARGQDYLRYIGKKSKVAEAHHEGEDYEAYLNCQIAETTAKIAAQERTGKAKVLLKRGGERLQPRAVREPVEKEDAEGKGSVTQALRDALHALMESQKLAPPELLEAGQKALERHAEMVKRRAHAKAEREEKKREKHQAEQMVVAKALDAMEAKREEAKAEAPAPAPEAPAPAPKAPAPPAAPTAQRQSPVMACPGNGSARCAKKTAIFKNTMLRNTADMPCCEACQRPEEEAEEELDEEEAEEDEDE